MTDYIDHAFKDSHPSATVSRIKEILASHGIQTTETWQESSVPDCHAMCVSIDGTTLRSNGKGITRELALASGYGELMERLQMGITGSAENQKAGLQPEISGPTMVSAQQLWEQNQSWYEALSKKLLACTGVSMSPHDILWRFANRDGLVAVRQYVMPGGSAAYFPAEIAQRIYCTNGCAAGNTMEETMVQALSEIMERHHQMRILHEDLTPPNIPDDVLKGYADPWTTICYLREQGFQVLVKDCSFGTSFPVVCVCLIHRATGRYHAHFGAFPVFEIALQRALTESFQGRTLENVAQFQTYSTKKPGEHSFCAVGNEVFFGSWEKTEKFFTAEPDFPYNPNQGFRGTSNRELLLQCLDFLRSECHQVLVQDHSALGFPTCQILIPGISEVMIHRLHPNLDDTRYTLPASKCLRCPSTASITDAMGLFMHLQQLDQFGPKVRQSKGFSFCARLPLTISQSESDRLMLATICHINYTIGRMGEVMQGISKLIRLSQGDDRLRLVQLANSLQAVTPGQNPFDEFVLHCDLIHCDSCSMASKCCYQQNSRLSALITQKTKDLDAQTFIEFMKAL